MKIDFELLENPELIPFEHDSEFIHTYKIRIKAGCIGEPIMGYESEEILSWFKSAIQDLEKLAEKIIPVDFTPPAPEAA